ncbi:hypothetical protein J4475_03130 [Candidatus Woesearchaeota archaeon]|nr:hypothetical protein [Candidatus Woesearchaeota archaeon]
MSYKPLFDSIMAQLATQTADRSAVFFPFLELYRLQTFDGTLMQVVDDLQTSLSAPYTAETLANVALAGGRLVRGTVDFRIKNPDEPGIDELFQEVTDYAVFLYQEYPNRVAVRNELGRLKDRLASSKAANTQVVQKADEAKWLSAQPVLLQQTLEELMGAVDSRDILLIALGHGGVVPGLDLFSRWHTFAGSDNSAFYTVRFSRHVSGDKNPQLMPYDAKKLRQLSCGRSVVLFDEDTSPGGTIERARRVFSKHIFPGIKIVEAVNADYRT